MDKWEWAVKYLAKHGIWADKDAIWAAVDAAWVQLNLGQIAAGIKPPEANIVVNPGARG